MRPPSDSVISRAAEPPAGAPRGFGRRKTGAAPTAAASSLSPVARAFADARRAAEIPLAAAPDEPARSPLRRFLVTGAMLAALSSVYFLQFSTIGLPGCDSDKTRLLLRDIAREALTKTKIAYRRIDFGETGDLPQEKNGVSRCESVLLVDNRAAMKFVYEISWNVRLVMFNSYRVKVVAAEPI